METIEIQANGQPTLELKSIGGSLRVTGKSDGVLEIKAHENSGLQVEEQADRIVVECRSNCTVFAPEESEFDIDTVGGELFLTGVHGEVKIRTVGGDIRIRRTGPTTIELVGGDLSARGIQGDLIVDRIGGDALVEQVTGDVRIKRVGGDIRIAYVNGLLAIEAGGDGVVDLSPPEGSNSNVGVGGDLLCRLLPESSVIIRLDAGGELASTFPEGIITKHSEGEIQLGQGAAILNLQAGGDLQLDGESFTVEDASVDLGEAIAARIGAEIEAEMAEIEARLEGIGSEYESFDAEIVNRKIHHALAKAQRKAERARRKAEERSRRSNRKTKTAETRLVFQEAKAGATDQERQVVLRMLEEGKVTVEEAEKLLQALEGDE